MEYPRSTDIGRRPHRKGLVIAAVLAAAMVFPLQSQAADQLTSESETVTYNSHVAEIVNRNCVVCHREGGIAPMQLTSFEQVRPWAPVISHKVARREMPPSLCLRPRHRHPAPPGRLASEAGGNRYCCRLGGGGCSPWRSEYRSTHS